MANRMTPYFASLLCIVWGMSHAAMAGSMFPDRFGLVGFMLLTSGVGWISAGVHWFDHVTHNSQR